MARPPKKRTIENIPEYIYFKPAGVPKSKLKEYILTFEELEAIRIKDIEGLDNEDCAAKMTVSRTTFQRVLGMARHKIALALLNGGAIRINGGNYQIAEELLQCPHCNFRNNKAFVCDKVDKDKDCPKFAAEL